MRMDLGKSGVRVMGTWSSSTAYEKNDIVTNGGDGYISITDVPSGTALSDTDYWMQIVNGFDESEVVSAVNAWLVAHPEATTTVQDGAVTTAKIADGAVTDEKLAQSGGILDKVEEIGEAFDYENIELSLSAFVSGKYMGVDGVIADDRTMQYTTVTVTQELVSKKLFISGTAWYSIKPYVFITDNSEVIPSTVPNPAGTVTQHTDLEFVPNTTGTLYINRYSSGSTIQIAKAFYVGLSNLKPEYLPSDIGSTILDAVSYKPITLTMTQNKVLSRTTGEITDADSASNRVSQYVEVNEESYYLISTEHFWSMGMYAWYDEDKKFISGVGANSGGTVTKIYCQKVKSPKNAKYLVIGFLYQASYPFPFLMEGEMGSTLPSKKWNGKKWACIGDSLTEAYTVTGAHYFDLIAAATGIEVVNMGISGSGYARGNNTFMDRALTVPTDSDVVTFFGSGNDASAGLELGTATDTGTTTLGGCINTAIDNLYTIMPVVQLGIVTPTPWQGNMPSNNGWMERYSNLIVEICRLRSIPCLDLFHCSNLNPNSQAVREAAYSRDGGGGVHPDETGHKIIAPRIKAFLETLLI